MKGYIQEEQQDQIKGWQDDHQSPTYSNICSKLNQHSPNDSPIKKIESSENKLPLKEHRRSTSKPLPFTKFLDRTHLNLDKQILHRFLPKNSKRNNKHQVQTHPLNDLSTINFKPQSKREKQPIKGTNFQLKENSNPDGYKTDLFSQLKFQKRNCRKFYAKSKLVYQLYQNTIQQKKHCQRFSQKFGPKKSDLQMKNKLSAPQESYLNKSPRNKEKKMNKAKKFPVFFRQIQIQQQREHQRKLYKRLLQQKIRKRKKHSHFMLTSSNFFSASIQFTDDNIFPKQLFRC